MQLEIFVNNEILAYYFFIFEQGFSSISKINHEITNIGISQKLLCHESWVWNNYFFCSSSCKKMKFLLLADQDEQKVAKPFSAYRTHMYTTLYVPTFWKSIVEWHLLKGSFLEGRVSFFSISRFCTVFPKMFHFIISAITVTVHVTSVLLSQLFILSAIRKCHKQSQKNVYLSEKLKKRIHYYNSLTFHSFILLYVGHTAISSLLK